MFPENTYKLLFWTCLCMTVATAAHCAVVIHDSSTMEPSVSNPQPPECVVVTGPTVEIDFFKAQRTRTGGTSSNIVFVGARVYLLPTYVVVEWGKGFRAVYPREVVCGIVTHDYEYPANEHGT